MTEVSLTMSSSEQGHDTACAVGESADSVLIQTACRDWSLNVYAEGNRRFWWNETYSISIWECVLDLPQTVAEADLTDTDVWRAYIAYNLHTVYKMCVTCGGPECVEDMMICCYCGGCVHPSCSCIAQRRQVAWKAANTGYERFMRVCFACNGTKHRKGSSTPTTSSHDSCPVELSLRRAVRRALTLLHEYSPRIAYEVRALASMVVGEGESEMSSARCGAVDDKSHGRVVGSVDMAQAMGRLCELMVSVYQPGNSARLFGKQSIATKGGGVGIVALHNVAPFTIVGVYPGYKDIMCGEQVKHGRPAPRYALMDYNCADFDNHVFAELQDTLTPFVNEPGVNERSNCAWIEEPSSNSGRLSIITLSPLRRGDELLICYGPLYHRDYAYCYDAYSCDRVTADVEATRPRYAVWHWPNMETTSATFVRYIVYHAETNTYVADDEQ